MSYNQLAIILIATALAPFQSYAASLGDGCLHIYLDLGANAGVQARKLYESSKFKSSPNSIMKEFNKHFGEGDHRDVCTFAFEPNPLHAMRLVEMQAVYRSLGIRYTIFGAAISTINTSLTLTKPGSSTEAAAHLSHTKIKGGVEVPVIDFLEFFRNNVVNRKLPVTTKTGRVLMKMDIEGEEFNLLPKLFASGLLCAGLDTGIVEYHFRNSAPHINKVNKDYNTTLTVQQVKEAMFSMNHMLLLARAAGVCKAEIKKLDDESYIYDNFKDNPLIPFSGFDKVCKNRPPGRPCLLTRPPPGMTPEQHENIVLGQERGLDQHTVASLIGLK